MSRTPLYALLICLAVCVPRAAMAEGGGAGESLTVDNILQETPLWCWAAVSEQVIKFYKGTDSLPPQCALVEEALSLPGGSCCDSRGEYNLGLPCLNFGWASQIQGLIARHAGMDTRVAPPVDWTELYGEITAGRPVLIGYANHIVVLRGMSFVEGVPYLELNDPMEVYPQSIPFKYILGSWSETIFITGPLKSQGADTAMR